MAGSQKITRQRLETLARIYSLARRWLGARNSALSNSSPLTGREEDLYYTISFLPLDGGGWVGVTIKKTVMPLCGRMLPQSPGIYRAVRLNYQHGRSLDLGRECSPLGAMTAIFFKRTIPSARTSESGEQILANATGGSPAIVKYHNL